MSLYQGIDVIMLWYQIREHIEIRGSQSRKTFLTSSLTLTNPIIWLSGVHTWCLAHAVIITHSCRLLSQEVFAWNDSPTTQRINKQLPSTMDTPNSLQGRSQQALSQRNLWGCAPRSSRRNTWRPSPAHLEPTIIQDRIKAVLVGNPEQVTWTVRQDTGGLESDCRRDIRCHCCVAG